MEFDELIKFQPDLSWQGLFPYSVASGNSLKKPMLNEG